MEAEEIQTNASMFSRVRNGRRDSNKIGQNGGEQYQDDEEEGEVRRGVGLGVGGSSVTLGGNGNDGGRLRGWHNSSRIIRVSRASGGKDRHSKVLTSRGLRDRRIRLSVTTAIQFYDLQDRLGYDQPSKAVDWLINAAAEPIAELPSLNNSFPNTPKHPSDEKGPSEYGFDSANAELEGEANMQQQPQHFSLSKSACSSTSETSKGSGLSLSRSEIRVNRVKARERARERTAKEKEKEKENESRPAHHHNGNTISQNASFTELLTAGIGSISNTTTCTAAATSAQQTRQWSSTPIEYFSSGLLAPHSSRANHSSGYSGQIHMGNSLPQTMTVPGFNMVGDHQPELQHFSLVPDHLIPVTSQSGSDYNLNFTISSSLAGFNRGTLQSNSPSLLPHLQRYSPADGSNLPFLIGAATPVENHHQFPSGFDGRLQLCYGDGSRHSDQKGKGKN